jgi:hypothetical protein
MSPTRYFLNFTAGASLLTAATFLHAALVGGTINYVQSIRVESGLIYIAFDGTLGGTCGNRAWVDPNSPHGKAIHATAMLAFSIPKIVRARAYEESTRSNGACQLFDLEVSNA